MISFFLFEISKPFFGVFVALPFPVNLITFGALPKFLNIDVLVLETERLDGLFVVHENEIPTIALDAPRE